MNEAQAVGHTSDDGLMDLGDWRWKNDVFLASDCDCDCNCDCDGFVPERRGRTND